MLFVCFAWSAKGRFSLYTQELPQTKISLQFNAKPWQLIDWEELWSLSGVRRRDNSVQRAVPLNELYPELQRLEYIELRNQMGEALELKLKSLEEVFIEPDASGQFWIIANGQKHGAAEQIDVHGEPFAKATLHIWAEQGFAPSFLLVALETYQRFHKIEIELRIFRNLPQTLSRSLGKAQMPDMILATRKTTFLLRNLLQGQAPDYQSTIAYSELFVQNGQHYSLPIALQPWSLVYNLNLIDFPQTGAKKGGARLKLSEFFAQMQELHDSHNGTANPYVLGLGEDSLPFSLLLDSFLEPNTGAEALRPDNPALQSGLQYLRGQVQNGLLRKFDYVEERFAGGQIAAIITRDWNHTEGNNSARIQALPYNDISGNDISGSPRIWSLGILRSSALQAQAESLRRYLSGAAVQSQLDVRDGILPSNTAYYPFYQKSTYYALLPEAERRYAMNPEAVWDRDIQQRDRFRRIEELEFGIDWLDPLWNAPLPNKMPETAQLLFLR